MSSSYIQGAGVDGCVSCSISSSVAFTASAGHNGFNAQGTLRAPTVQTYYLQNTGSPVNQLVLQYESIDFLNKIRFMDLDRIEWNSFPNLWLFPSTHWLYISQSNVAEGSMNKFEGLSVYGSITSSIGFKGNLQGSSSYATNALSASYAATASIATSASYSGTASFAMNAAGLGTGVNNNIPYWLNNSLTPSSSLFVTSSATRGQHLVLGPTNIYDDTLILGGVANYDISSSARLATAAGQVFLDASASNKTYINFYSGGDVILAGNDNGNVGVNVTNPTHTLHVNGQILATGITGSLRGHARTATSASYASSSLSSSYALTASYAENAGGGGSGTSLGTGSTYPFTASWAVSASYVETASYSVTNVITQSVFQSSSSFASASLTSSYFYSAYSTGSWNQYVNKTNGDLIFKFI
jgi:hypothetical protein